VDAADCADERVSPPPLTPAHADSSTTKAMPTNSFAPLPVAPEADLAELTQDTRNHPVVVTAPP
jgi:hypothetical protein